MASLIIIVYYIIFTLYLSNCLPTKLSRQTPNHKDSKYAIVQKTPPRSSIYSQQVIIFNNISTSVPSNDQSIATTPNDDISTETAKISDTGANGGGTSVDGDDV